MKTVGVVTIGQSPRSDVVAELESLLKDSRTPSPVTFLQKGALDGLSTDEIAELRPAREKDHLVTALQDGKEVAVDKHAICPRVQQAILDLNREGADIVTLLCSDEFPPFRSDAPLLLPAKLLSGMLLSLSIPGKLGVMVPSERQIDVTAAFYQGLGFEPIVIAASPYAGRNAILSAADGLKGEVALVVMDCFGYNQKMKKQVRERTGTPVILARSVLAWALRQYLD